MTMARKKEQGAKAEGVSPQDDRNPETCGNSIGFDGVYLCRLACLPCAATKKCAKTEIEEMASETAHIMQQKRQRKNGMYHT